MVVTARELNRATLARQSLLERDATNVVDATQRVLAIQAQDPAAPYLALWARVRGFDPGALDRAFVDGRLVRANLFRVTMHVVHVDDYAPVYAAMQSTLRGARLADARFTQTGLAAADVDAVLPELVRYAGQPRTAEELQSWLADRLAIDAKWVWWALRHVAPLVHAPSGGPWMFAQPRRYAAALPLEEFAGRQQHESVPLLVRRYLQAYGPASVADIAQFMLLPRSVIRAAVTHLGSELDQLTDATGKELFDLPGSPRPSGDEPAPPRLLPMWDNVLLAYQDRSRMIAPEWRASVIRRNGDVLPTLLIDGYVAGVWRSLNESIEVAAFRKLEPREWDAVAAEASGLATLLASRDAKLYRRQDHWWDQSLPVNRLRTFGPV